MIDPELLANTTRHAASRLDRIESEVRRWSTALPERDRIAAVFRQLHAIKGGFGFLGLQTITTLVHGIEEAIAEIRDHLVPLRPALHRALLGSLQTLRFLLADPLGNDGIVDIGDDLDALLTSRGLEPLRDDQDDLPGSAPILPLEPTPTQLRQAQRRAEHIYRLTIFSHEDIEDRGRTPLDVNDDLVRIGSPLAIGIDIDCVGGLDDCLGVDLAYQVLLMSDAGLARIAEAVQLPLDQIELMLGSDSLTGAAAAERRLPLTLAFVLEAMAAVGGDLAHRLGKRVRFTTGAPDLVLGEQQFQEIQAALAHLLRNALDHGVESIAERRAAGKPGTAHIALTAERDGAGLRITVRDDGRGIDRPRILARAIERGLLTPEAAEHADTAAIERLIFTPGFSSRDHSAAYSGRGMGMQVVRHTVALFAGRVTLASEPGRFTATTLHLGGDRLAGPLPSPALTARQAAAADGRDRD